MRSTAEFGDGAGYHAGLIRGYEGCNILDFGECRKAFQDPFDLSSVKAFRFTHWHFNNTEGVR